MINQSSEYFRRRAEECEHLAQEFQERIEREALYYLATRWRALAEVEEQHQKRSAKTDRAPTANG